MTAKELDNLVEIQQLKKEPPEQKEFDGLLAAGRAALKDAQVAGLSFDGRFARTYDAAHSFALAALRWHGYRPNKIRYVVFQVLPHTLGTAAERVRVLGECHRRRNLAEYEGQFEIDERLMKELLAATNEIHDAVSKLGKI